MNKIQKTNLDGLNQQVLQGGSHALGNFLHRNQYGLWFSDRCNYKCSYCCNNASPKAPKSNIENNPEALISLFNQVDPGIIMVTGGEPTLWADFPLLIKALPQHYWVILTNLTTIPDWFQHPNIKLLLPAYHEEFAKPDRFTDYLAQLKAMGKRVHTKIIVKPGQEYNQIPLWEIWNGMGIPASLVPLEFDFYFKREFIKDVLYQFRTCALYNSRFFKRQVPVNQTCIAGTKRSFQVNSDGSLVRCSAVFERVGGEKPGTIWEPSFNQTAKHCSSVNCFCEWHHWGQMALANDNGTWTHFIETGEWIIPSVEELCQFVLDMNWDVAGRDVEKSKQSIFDLSSLSESLKLRVQSNQADVDLEQSKVELERVQANLEKVQKSYQSQLQQIKITLERVQAENEQLKLQIAYMQGSKFWRIRSYWLKLKQIFMPQTSC